VPSSLPLMGGGRLDTVAQAISVETQKVTFLYQQDAPSCSDCGSIMVRNGSCYKCLNCGSTSGCS
jgi:ribonucleoside-diphosphate reductase alpha chain